MSSHCRREYTAVVDRRTYPVWKMTGELFSVIEVSMTPGSLFQRCNYGLDRWKIAIRQRAARRATSKSRVWNRYAFIYISYNMRTRDATQETRAAESTNTTISLSLSLSLSPLPLFFSFSSASRGFSEPKRAGTCPGIWNTCRSLLKIDSSLYATQCAPYVHFRACKNPHEAANHSIASRSAFLEKGNQKFNLITVKFNKK